MNTSLFIVFASLFIVTSCSTNTTEDVLGAVKNALPDAVELAKKSFAKSGSDDILSKLPSSLDNINLPAGTNLSSLPSIEEGEELVRKKCLQNGKNDSYEQYVIAKEELQYCVKDIVNVDTVKTEIEKYKPTGDLDIVFKKYCKKMPTLKSCIANFTSAVDPCLEESEKISIPIIKNITESLDRFICYKEGDRIALFIAEGGPECLNDKQEAINHCVNDTFFNKMSNEGDMNSLNKLDNLPVFKLNESQCRDIYKLQICVVTELQKCNEPTPANIVDSLFSFVRHGTPCSQYQFEPSAGFISFSPPSIAVILSSLFVFMLTFCPRYV